MRSLEECAEVVLRKWPIACDAEDWGVRTVTPAELLADDDGRPSKWLWALWFEHGVGLSRYRFPEEHWSAASLHVAPRAGATATEAMTRALCALAEAS